ncbi:hypothetical protein FHETE_2379 [Fusarium heterosporum]|uniref:Uncharacterized protein n=1 Tax=Fusarium heterosporum TaxID=42747 RepID=A0A8H5TR76_FUSHE|nr:hypothetical protein FHETE_2379 [Fusarium heterosporum]
MPVSFACKPEDFGGLTPHQVELLYEPIILEVALKKVRTFPTYEDESQSCGYEATMPDLKALRFYVDRFAQVCDNERGGDTISALAVLQGSNGPHYVFGANRKDERGLARTEEYVRGLLDLVGRNPEELNPAALEKRTLWSILSFNLSRLREYLSYLAQAVKECEASCQRLDKDRDENPYQGVLSLKEHCTFKLDTTDETTGNKSSAISDCEKLIKMIHNLGQSNFNATISEMAKDGEITKSDTWCNLRHFLGRWLSYRRAALGIIEVSKRWPDLFREFEITMISSGSRLPNPILRSDLTSSIIVQHIIAEDKIEDTELKNAADGLPHLQIDNVIQDFYNSRKFRPLLHAEILVYEYLLKSGQAATESYWNRWNYIGSTLHGDKPFVRLSHGNLYRNWRFPEFQKNDNNENENQESDNHDEARDEILKRIAQRMREDVVRTLREKRIKWKARDSNTNSSAPEFLRSLVDTSTPMEDSDRESIASTIPEEDESLAVLEHSTGDMDLRDGDE